MRGLKFVTQFFFFSLQSFAVMIQLGEFTPIKAYMKTIYKTINDYYLPAVFQYSQECTWHLQKWCLSRSRSQQLHQTPAPASERSCNMNLQL